MWRVEVFGMREALRYFHQTRDLKIKSDALGYDTNGPSLEIKI